MIYGIKNNKSEIQALRYPKEKWTADDARTHCKSRGGSFEAASEKKEDEVPEIRKIKVGRQYREFQIEKRQIDEAKRTVDLSFSFEEPVDWWWGIEILDHQKKSVNLRRLIRGGALLIDHDMKNQVGVIEEVVVDEATERAAPTCGSGGVPRPKKSSRMCSTESVECVGGVSDRRGVLERETKGELSTYRVVDWEPYEISLVSVPADINVGVGRGDEEGKDITIKIPIREEKEDRIEVLDREERQMSAKCEKCHQNLVDGKCPACELERQIEDRNGKIKDLSALELEKGESGRSRISAS